MTSKARQNVITLNDIVNVRAYGIQSDGLSDQTAAINAVLNSGSKSIYFPAGTYRIDGTLNVPRGVSIFGDGQNVTVFDAAQAVDGNITSNAHITTPEATYVALPALSVSPAKNDRTLTFASAPSVQSGDIIVIYNPTDFSWHPSRSYYRAGEQVRVATVSGSVVTLEGTLCDSYAASAVTVYRIDNMTSANWRGFTLIGKRNSSLPITGVDFQSAKDSSLEDIRVVGATYIGIAVSLSFAVQVRNCVAEEDYIDQFGGEYGLALLNSHSVNVSGGYFCSRRHGITIGGGSGIGRVPNRYFVITGATISTTGGSQAADIHGNAEYITYADCMIDGGVAGFGGDYQTVDNCQIRGKQQNGPVAILFSEMRGANFRITNNTIQNDQIALLRGALIDIGGNSIVLSNETTKGGTIVISNNTMQWSHSSSTGNQAGINIRNRGYVGAEPVSVVVKDNVIVCAPQVFHRAVFIDSVASSNGNPFEEVIVSGNLLSGGGIDLTGTPVNTITVAKKVAIQNNMVFRAQFFRAVDVKNILISGNMLRNSAVFPGILASGRSADLADIITVTGNTIIDGPFAESGSSATDVCLRVTNAFVAYVTNNVGGYSGEVLRVASATGFQLGETVTGGTSGETATILAIASNTLGIGFTASGTFTPTETLTGSVSGATTTLTSQGVAQNNFAAYVDITTLFRGQNTNMGPGSDSLSSITNDMFQFISPGYTTTARDALTIPIRGQIVLNTTTGKLNFYTGSTWEAVTSS
jgi:hypothetical protein